MTNSAYPSFYTVKLKYPTGFKLSRRALQMICNTYKYKVISDSVMEVEAIRRVPALLIINKTAQNKLTLHTDIYSVFTKL